MNKALFLDRDGIINIDHGYVYQKRNFEFVNGIFDLCAKAKANGYLIIVITNQSGIGRGKYTEAQFLELSDWMNQQFQMRGITINDIFFCPHHPKSALGQYLKKCNCRKPKPGMLIEAAEKHSIALEQSVFIGDKASDMEAASAAGIVNCILVNGESNAKSDKSTMVVEKICDLKLRFDGFVQ